MKNINDLIRKYWKGTSEVNEEQKLKEFFHKNGNIEPQDEYFNYLSHKQKEKLNDPDFDMEVLRLISEKQDIKRSLFQKINWQVAAVVLLLFSAGAIFINRQMNTNNTIALSDQLIFVDTYDNPHLAYEETKKALLLISSKLNKGNEYAAELVKFSETQENLKN